MPQLRRWQQGFTLIEILVVVFIIGVILGFATLSLSGRALDDKVQEEARRLSEILRLARDEAGLTGLELGWLKTDEGYRFVALSDNGWAEYGERTPLRPRRIEAPLKMTVRVDDLPIETDDDQLLPQVMILSSGEMTPFAIELGAPDLDFVFLISGNLLGEIALEKVDPDDLVLRES
ncbi:general secretion pathway protein H [Oceanococcus atlanticus]|uniref:Type II secretion system protein H n=1 Tax=Oceanococcus atlanticus TaxID=1317117 RepID=A0A1Y1SC99_9GAMM|nr:type II secretion system minor pseudopilin GspH [Oceanococcus atlanticus]ORE86248.1 general secretion pathway protein H [Oceanococcus atlanticus]